MAATSMPRRRIHHLLSVSMLSLIILLMLALSLLNLGFAYMNWQYRQDLMSWQKKTEAHYATYCSRGAGT